MIKFNDEIKDGEIYKTLVDWNPKPGETFINRTGFVVILIVTNSVTGERCGVSLSGGFTNLSSHFTNEYRKCDVEMVVVPKKN